MFRACAKCGKIHKHGDVCPNVKSNRGKHKRGDFRYTYRWQQLRSIVLDRDYHLCRVCLDGKYGDTRKQYGLNPKLEVHHIVPIVEDDSLKDEQDNLITLCRYHHELAEDNQIPRQYLADLAKKDSPDWGKNF